MNKNLPVILLALSLTACTGVRAPKTPRADPYTPQQIHVATEELRRDTAVGTPIVKRDSSGDLVQVTVPIRSAIDKDLYVDYWVTFFDRDGQVLSKLGPFQKNLQANTPDSIHVNSMSPRAYDFQIDLRYAR
jgi:hypothetical protein